MIDPVTAVIIKSGGTWLLSKFRTLVIDRWSKKRAEAFFETFVERVATVDNTGAPINDVRPLLDTIFQDDRKSEAMFEAYRRVCLSASASLGPRIIAVLTARIVNEGRLASAEEERLFLAAETLGDSDLKEFANYISRHPHQGYTIDLCKESEDSKRWGGSHALGIGPVNLSETVGNWCIKLANCGLVVQDIEKESRDYHADSERHIDEPGTVTTYTWKLIFQPEVDELESIVRELILED